MRIDREDMFFGATPEIFRRASELRKNMTEAEKILWSALRRKQILNKRFRRQHPIDCFIADFYCHEAKLIIEVDGSIHKQIEQKERDEGRTFDLEAFGLKVIRFTNDQIRKNLKEVMEEIKKAIERE